MAQLTLDLRVGGLGDNWMRLLGFYAASALLPDCKLRLVLPEVLLRSAQCAFGDRLDLATRPSGRAVTYAVRGVRDLLWPVFRGERFASPYGRVVLHDWNRWSARDRLNSAALSALDYLGLIVSPPWPSLAEYQGYSEVATLPLFRGISTGQFNRQLEEDRNHVSARMQAAPISPQFKAPAMDPGRVVVFPTGTARQFMPLGWAQKHLPSATFAFFYKDPDMELWNRRGLKTVAFFEEPGDMLAIAKTGRVAVTTDSFPSHYLQACVRDLVVLITEVGQHRIIAPGFKGAVVDAVAPCHPCPHLERRSFPECKAGHEVCLNWDSPVYTARILEAISRAGAKSD